MVCRNHVFDGGPEVLKDIAMATNFGTQFAITGFLGYNFGCMIVTRWWFLAWVLGVKLLNEDVAEIKCLRDVSMATNFWTKTAINQLCVNDSD